MGASSWVRDLNEDVMALRRETTMLLDDTLGSEHRHALRVRGETLDEDQAVAYALDAIARARPDRRE